MGEHTGVNLCYISERKKGEAVLHIVQDGGHAEYPLTLNQLTNIIVAGVKIW